MQFQISLFYTYVQNPYIAIVSVHQVTKISYYSENNFKLFKFFRVLSNSVAFLDSSSYMSIYFLIFRFFMSSNRGDKKLLYFVIKFYHPFFPCIINMNKNSLIIYIRIHQKLYRLIVFNIYYQTLFIHQLKCK